MTEKTQKKTRTKKHTGWTRLDNAAKIFPSTSDKLDTKVFRFVCELTENVNPALLQSALNQTLQIFHGYLSVMRHGFFWYYLESTDLRPKVHIENRQVCYPLYDRNEPSLLFDVSYFKKRINVEVYHALADGTGALTFLRELTCCYLGLAHPELLKTNLHGAGIDASASEKMADSFQKYYRATAKNLKKLPKAYRLRGAHLPEYNPKVIEGILPVDKVRALSKTYQTTITVLLISIFICSIFDGMSIRDRRRPVTLSVPVNLRNYFPSETVRNFFGVTYVSYRQSDGEVNLSDVIKSISTQFKENLTKEKLQAIVNSFVSIEKNAVIRAIPLQIKDFGLKFAYTVNDKTITAAFSNIGQVKMPDGYDKYIRLFDVMTSTKKLQICMCSFKNNLVVNFTDTLVSADVQKHFFRTLSSMDIPVTLVTTPLDEEAATHGTL